MNYIPTIESYFRDIEKGITANFVEKYYAPDATQTEQPNLLTPHGTVYKVADIKKGTLTGGKGILSSQRIDISKIYQSGHTVIAEALWIGTLALPIGQIPIGGQMKAHITRIFEFENGKIVRQRNYDCFEPF